MRNFQEKYHPRDTAGKFTDGGKTVSAIRKYSSDPKSDLEHGNIPNAKKKGVSQEEFFGEEFNGVKGTAAIDKLLKEKRGHVKNAFTRPEIGGIDLVWGNKDGGLLHTIQKRDKLLAKGIGHISGLDMVKKIPEIVEKGAFNTDDSRLNIDYGNYRVGIIPEYYNEKINWVVTAMEKLQ